MVPVWPRLTEQPRDPEAFGQLFQEWSRAVEETVSICLRQTPAVTDVRAELSCLSHRFPRGGIYLRSSLPREGRASTQLLIPSCRCRTKVPKVPRIQTLLRSTTCLLRSGRNAAGVSM